MSVVACNVLNYCPLPTDTPAVGVSVIDVVPHRHPATGVSVVNMHVYCGLRPTTDTYNLKGGNIFSSSFSFSYASEVAFQKIIRNHHSEFNFILYLCQWTISPLCGQVGQDILRKDVYERYLLLSNLANLNVKKIRQRKRPLRVYYTSVRWAVKPMPVSVYTHGVG